jgi:general L-amino acid transport system substrate-binding protein
VLNALLAAEEHGITRANVTALRASSRDPEIQRMLGTVPGYGRVLGLDEGWAYRAIRATGNYEEIWTRHIGPLGVPRGYNRLYRDGGLLYPLPMQ